MSAGRVNAALLLVLLFSGVAPAFGRGKFRGGKGGSCGSSNTCPNIPSDCVQTRCTEDGGSTTVIRQCVKGSNVSYMIAEYGPPGARQCAKRESIGAGDVAFELSTRCGETVSIYAHDGQFNNPDAVDKGVCSQRFSNDSCKTCGPYEFTVECAGVPCSGGGDGECIVGGSGVTDDNCSCKATPAGNGTLCGDGDSVCSASTCQDGVCTTTDKDGETCGDADGECGGVSVCSGGECLATPAQNGAPCGDDLGVCSTSTCRDGECVTTDNDGATCGTAGGECENDPFCSAGGCLGNPKPDGASCGAGETACSISTCLAAGCFTAPKEDGTVCGGVEGECGGLSVCFDGECVPSSPVGNGTPCGDGDGVCSSSTCQDGVCTTTDKDGEICGDAEGECRVSVCSSGECAAASASNGTPCGNGDSDDSCSASTCQDGTCTTTPKGDGEVCKTVDKPCQGDSVCEAGICVDKFFGSEKVCRKSRDPCDQGEVCDGSSAECPEDVCVGGYDYKSKY